MDEADSASDLGGGTDDIFHASLHGYPGLDPEGGCRGCAHPPLDRNSIRTPPEPPLLTWQFYYNMGVMPETL